MPSINESALTLLRESNPAAFGSCVQYARAFNTLDSGPLSQILAQDVVYGSQHVFEELQGRPRVLEYLSGKIGALRRAGTNAEVAMEVGGAPGNRRIPGLVVWQRSAADAELTRVAWLDLQYDSDGRITRLWMCGVAPSAASAMATGSFPGRL